MRSKSIVLLALALGCGLAASIGISQVMNKGPQTDAGETTAIFVAAADINPDTALTAQVLKLEEWPKDKIPAGALSKLEEVEGKRCRSKVYAGEPILAAKLFGSGDKNLPSGVIPPGYRVVAVGVNPVSGGGSLIHPGDRVNVLVYMSKNPNTGIAATSARTILQDIKVFAVNTAFVGKSEKDQQIVAAKTISLLVTLQQAQVVTLATQLGTIRLVMRGPTDSADTATEPVGPGEIFTSKSDRDQEAQFDVAKPSNVPATTWTNDPNPAPVSPTPVAQNLRKMIIIEGTSVREVQLPPDGGVPKEVLSDPSSKSDESDAAKDAADKSDDADQI